MQVIQDALQLCHHFADTFGKEFNNLFLYGDVGVGKTFLSNCIAKELMDREYSVLYFSSSKFFSILAKNTFDKNNIDAQNMYEYIFDCDLLIVDDLGTEFTNSFVASQFFTCINERLLSRKSTIISTNLSPVSYTHLSLPCSNMPLKRNPVRPSNKINVIIIEKGNSLFSIDHFT